MLNNKTIAVVVPAFNEESQIGMVIESMPSFVDRIIIANDLSNDKTASVVLGYIDSDKTVNTSLTNKLAREFDRNRYNYAEEVLYEQSKEEVKLFNPLEIANTNRETDRVILINHTANGGVGAAIASGYKWCKDHDIHCTAVMAGDGQMDPGELESICLPVINEGVDYVIRSNQLREGAISRETALEKTNAGNQPRWDSIMWYCNTIGIDFNSTIKTINKIDSLYEK